MSNGVGGCGGGMLVTPLLLRGSNQLFVVLLLLLLLLTVAEFLDNHGLFSSISSFGLPETL